jgi:exopolyphosphatase/pppGpp-phosphohydrolase
MKSNAIKFNGQANSIAQEAVAIHEYVKDQIDSNREELSALEEAVEEQMSTKPTKKKKGLSKKAAGASSGTVATFGGVDVNLGDLSKSMHFDGDEDSDSDESFSGLLGDL